MVGPAAALKACSSDKGTLGMVTLSREQVAECGRRYICEGGTCTEPLLHNEAITITIGSSRRNAIDKQKKHTKKKKGRQNS